MLNAEIRRISLMHASRGRERQTVTGRDSETELNVPVTVTAFKWLCTGVLPEVSG